MTQGQWWSNRSTQLSQIAQCEQVLDALPCDVLVLKPADFKARVPAKSRGTQLLALHAAPAGRLQVDRQGILAQRASLIRWPTRLWPFPRAYAHRAVLPNPRRCG